jgi:hypothetical protein
MNQEQIWQDLSTLPPAARQQALDFIAFLRGRYAKSDSIEEKVKSSLREEPFVGIWHDNEAMTDSSAWVRKTRQSEWK